MADLSGLKPGDEIAVEDNFVIDVRRVSKVFKRWIEDDSGAKWNMNGSRRPYVQWDGAHACQATDGHREAVAERRERQRCVDALKRLVTDCARDIGLSRRVMAALEPVLSEEAAR